MLDGRAGKGVANQRDLNEIDGKGWQGWEVKKPKEKSFQNVNL